VLGETIRSPGEHPFFVRDKGWVPLHSIVAGDYVYTESSGWLCVEAVEDTGVWETVYNFRIAEWHTYFVGECGAVWSRFGAGVNFVRFCDFTALFFALALTQRDSFTRYIDSLQHIRQM
jgi:hypothetical protein